MTQKNVYGSRFTVLNFVVVQWEVPFTDSPAYEVVEHSVSFDNLCAAIMMFLSDIIVYAHTQKNV